MWNVLVSAAVGDQAIAGFFQVVSFNQDFDGPEEVVEEDCIRACEVRKTFEVALGDKQDVQRISGFGMLEG